MTSISSIPSTRVSDLLASQRLLSQLGADQTDLLRLQSQISTGHRLLLPSDDAPAALRAISLQSLLQRKDQIKTNVTTNQSYLSATDTALSSVSSLLTDARGAAIGVVGTTSTDTQRAAAAQEVASALQQLIDTGNQQFRGRYLFSGSLTTTKPFVNAGGYVHYNGNQATLSSFSDTDLLFPTNTDGDSVFGAISPGAKGSVDLNPIVNASTKLSDLRAGQGIGRGSIAVSDGVSVSTIDLSSAANLGDVARLIEAHPPTGRQVTATITSRGLDISLDNAGGGNLTVKEVGGGTTAQQLGILLEASGFGVGPLVGGDLNPQLTGATSLNDLLGAHAKAQIVSGSTNNNLTLEAVQNGAALNGVTVSFVDNPAITAGHETVAYDASNPANKKLVFQIQAGQTTANDILNALNNDPTAGTLFHASLDSNDQTSVADAGTGAITPAATATTAGGGGIQFDKAAGLQIDNGGKTYNIGFSTADTVEDLLNQINGSGAGVLAQINAQGTGIDVQSRVSGANFSIGENGGATAAQLGLRTFTTSTRLEDLNHGLGVHASGSPDFDIQRKDGTSLHINVSSAQTVGDVLNLINNDPANQNPANKVTAQLAAVGNGIQLVTSDPSNIAPFKVLQTNASQAAADLGLTAAGATSSAPASVVGGVSTITGADTNPGEVKGVFNSLLRLQHALQTNDQSEIQRSVAQLDDSSLQVTQARSELGARQQGLDALQSRLADEVVNLKDSLSKETDVDWASALSQYTNRQAAFQAALQTTAAISKLSLLNYL